MVMPGFEDLWEQFLNEMPRIRDVFRSKPELECVCKLMMATGVMQTVRAQAAAPEAVQPLLRLKLASTAMAAGTQSAEAMSKFAKEHGMEVPVFVQPGEIKL